LLDAWPPVYFGTAGGRLDPAYNAMIFTPGNKPELPLSAEERVAWRPATDNCHAAQAFVSLYPRR